MIKTREIGFFDYKFFHSHYAEMISSTVDDVVSRGAFILQQDLKKFENQFADYLGVKHAVGVANCTDGLTMIVRAVGLGCGDEVIIPTHTFIATASAVHFVGATPIPVDCGSDHLIDCEAIRKAITPKTRAILPVHLNGRTCQMDEIVKIADEYNLIVIEDAAQALGSKFHEKNAGSFGIASAFSFYPAKSLGCLGDGGIIATNNDELASKLRCDRDHGRNENGEINSWGVNSRLDNIHAAVLSRLLDHYPAAIDYRRGVAEHYRKLLNTVDQIKLPPDVNDPGHYDVYQNYEIEAENRDGLRKYLSESGVGTLIQWGGKAIHQHRKLGFTQELPKTDVMLAKSLMLPMNTSISLDDVTYICNEITNFYS